MAKAKSSQKKSKFDQYMTATFGIISSQKFGNQNTKNEIRGQSSSPSTISKENWVTLQGTKGHVAFPRLKDRAECCSICREDYSHLTEYDESIKGPNIMKQGDLNSLSKDSATSICYTYNTETLIKERPIMKFLEVPKSLVNEDFVYSSMASYSLSSEKEDIELNQPTKFLLWRGNHHQRLVIPIGPRFQAEVPKWEGTTNDRHDYSDYDLKWLGTQIWPMPDITETNTNSIWKVRPDSCSCDFPGSVDYLDNSCNRRLVLLSHVGSLWTREKMFQSHGHWKEDQKKFESLVKLNPLSNNTEFWKLALEHFSAKSMESMVNYYYNVYIPRRLSMETSSSFGAFDSDK